MVLWFSYVSTRSTCVGTESLLSERVSQKQSKKYTRKYSGGQNYCEQNLDTAVNLISNTTFFEMRPLEINALLFPGENRLNAFKRSLKNHMKRFPRRVSTLKSFKRP